MSYNEATLAVAFVHSGQRIKLLEQRVAELEDALLRTAALMQEMAKAHLRLIEARAGE